jgi:hypothetical protein
LGRTCPRISEAGGGEESALFALRAQFWLVRGNAVSLEGIGEGVRNLARAVFEPEE